MSRSVRTAAKTAPTAKPSAELAPVVSHVPLAQLRTYPGNPRRGSVDLIAASLARRGQYKPIVVSSDGVILAGNHTFLAAQQLGWETVAVFTVPVHSESPQATEIVLVDNRTADLGGYDDAALVSLLAGLADLDGLATGYTQADLDMLTDLLQTPPADVADLDAVLGEGDHAGRPTVTFQLDAQDLARWEALPGETHADRALYLLANHPWPELEPELALEAGGEE